MLPFKSPVILRRIINKKITKMKIEAAAKALTSYIYCDNVWHYERCSGLEFRYACDWEGPAKGWWPGEGFVYWDRYVPEEFWVTHAWYATWVEC